MKNLIKKNLSSDHCNCISVDFQHTIDWKLEDQIFIDPVFIQLKGKDDLIPCVISDYSYSGERKGRRIDLVFGQDDEIFLRCKAGDECTIKYKNVILGNGTIEEKYKTNTDCPLADVLYFPANLLCLCASIFLVYYGMSEGVSGFYLAFGILLLSLGFIAHSIRHLFIFYQRKIFSD